VEIGGNGPGILGVKDIFFHQNYHMFIVLVTANFSSNYEELLILTHIGTSALFKFFSAFSKLPSLG
jgi:hypothetical protein